MKTPKENGLYDPQTGSRLLRIKEVAAHLGYHPFSVYRLVARGVLKPDQSAGRTLLFLKENIDRFRVSSASAAEKAPIERLQTVPDKPVSALTAKVKIELSLLPVISIPVISMEDFTWDQVPLIRAQVDNGYGNKRFEIEIKSPDGAAWTVTYEPPAPPTLLEKGFKKLKKKLER